MVKLDVRLCVDRLKSQIKRHPPLSLDRITVLLLREHPNPTQEEVTALLSEVYKVRSSGRFLAKFMSLQEEHGGG